MQIQELALAYSALNDCPDSVTQYSLQGNQRLLKHLLEKNDFSSLVTKFQNDPKEVIANIRLSLFAIGQDSQMSQSERGERLERYIRHAINLQIKLDKEAFPANSKVQFGVPCYIPDGLVDMGSDTSVSMKNRNREMISVDKREVLSKSMDLIKDIYLNNIQDKVTIAKMVAKWVFINLPYTKDEKLMPKGKIPLSTYVLPKEPIAQCRHHALYCQVLNQFFGITSRVLKCNVKYDRSKSGVGGAHACNLIRLNNRWYLLDSTSPVVNEIHQKYEVCISPIPGGNIDPNSRSYTWVVPGNQGPEREYISRKNMYYIIE